MKVNNNLKVWRAKFEVTQNELAQKVKLSRQTIHSIEKGKFLPSVYSALKLAEFFQTTVEEIFYLEKGEQHED